MKTHEMAKLLLEQPNAELRISLDVSTCCLDKGRRVFAPTNDRTDFVYQKDGPNGDVQEVVLCMDGRPNFDFVAEYEPPLCDCKACKLRIVQDSRRMNLLLDRGVE